MQSWDLKPLKSVPILEIAKRLKIELRGSKAMCFTGHDDRTPSLSFSASKNTWKCYGACNKLGDGLSLVQEVMCCDIPGAIAWFEIEFGIKLHGPRVNRKLIHRTPKLSIPKSVTPIETNSKEFSEDSELYEWLLEKCGPISRPPGIAYLSEHGISLETANHFKVRELCNPSKVFTKLVEARVSDRVYRSGLAWGKDQIPERLIWTSYTILFPVHVDRRISCLQGRLFRGDRKFIVPRGASKPLFNNELLQSLPRGSRIHLCEGIPDALALASHGLNCIGVLGASAFRTEWVDSFSSFTVDVMIDSDSGGNTFWKTISKLFHERGMSVRPVRMPPGAKDVASAIASLRASL